MTNKAKDRKLSRSLRVYQRAAVVFLVLSLLLLLAVLYLSVSQATIRIIPVPQLVSTTFELNIVSEPAREGEVTGFLAQEQVVKSKTFTLPEEGSTAVEARATGFVTIKNETNAAQPLVATTRFLSSGGILFRLDEGVTIPANGEVQARVTADEPGTSGEVGPTRFTIPGLNITKQSTIYGESTEPMTGGVQFVRVLSEADVNSAIEELKQEMINDVRARLLTGIDTKVFDGEGFGVELTATEVDAEVGDEVGAFGVTATGIVTGAFYPRSVIADFATDQLVGELNEGMQLGLTNLEGMRVTLGNVSLEDERAEAEVYLDGLSVISEQNELLDKSRLAAQSPQTVKSLLNVPELIEEVNVSFQPFWLKRVPTLKDHIKINIVTKNLE